MPSHRHDLCYGTFHYLCTIYTRKTRMYKIFWAQNENPAQPSTMIEGDKMEAYTGTESQNRLMMKFGEVRQWTCTEAIAEQRGYNKKYDKGFNFAIKEGVGITINSSFLTKDVNGRRISYIFFTDNTDLDSSLTDLKHYAAMCGKELNLSELEEAIKDIKAGPSKPKDENASKLANIGGGYERIWQHIRRH